MKKKKKVVIIGGGVAGLSAAHELVERGFEVTVYERSRLGGKARSVPVEGSADDGHDPLPGEHGFRFFPGWYWHLPDTMRRIPYLKTQKTVLENLVSANENLLTSYGRDPISAVLSFPVEWRQLKLILKFPKEVIDLVPPEDLEFFARKLVKFVVSCEERRVADCEAVSWWDFMEADKRSPEFRRYLVEGATRGTVAAKARHASAYSIAKVAIQTFLDVVTPGRSVDRVLNGPTNEVWIEPWRQYLEEQGVVFRMHMEFDGAVWEAPGGRPVRRDDVAADAIRGARFVCARDLLNLAEGYVATFSAIDVWNSAIDAWNEANERRNVDRSVQALVSAAKVRILAAADVQTDPEQRDRLIATATAPPARIGFDFTNSLATEIECFLRKLFPSNIVDAAVAPVVAAGAAKAREDAKDWWGLVDFTGDDTRTKAIYDSYLEELTKCLVSVGLRRHFFDNLHRELLKIAERGLRAADRDYHIAEGDYFLFALPVEQMSYYIKRDATFTRHDPSLARIVRLSEHVDWMVGIQFYLNTRAPITRGHIDCLDSPWNLTAISQTQFWDDYDLKEKGYGDCKAILSVDISSWDLPGGRDPRAAWECSHDEIAMETWDQVKRSVNRSGRPEFLSDGMLCGGTTLKRGRNYYLDDSLVDRFDRKKQAYFSKFRRVAFDSDALLRRGGQGEPTVDVPYLHGSRLQVNCEPLLVNRCGSWALRPKAKTAIPNMFLAADFVQTYTNLATMEGANEAARHAVNAIIVDSGMTAEPCVVRPPSEWGESLRVIDKELWQRGERFEDVYTDIPIRLAGAGAKLVISSASKVLGSARDLWKAFKRP